MISVDIGGTKTLLWFDNNKKLMNFMEQSDFEIKKFDENGKYCIIETKQISSNRKFDRFVSILRFLDKTVISTFPGIVKVELGEVLKFRVFSRRFPFLMGKYLNFDFVINDAPAFTYRQAKNYFDGHHNIDKTILGVILGTGTNAAHMNYWDFKRLNFINRYFEAGHIKFNRSEDRCFCGRYGCAELYISGRHLEEISNGNPKEIFHNKDLKDAYCKDLSDFLISLILTISPHAVVFGGSVSRDIDLNLLRKMMERDMPHSRLNLNIEFMKDTSPFSNIEGLIDIYKRFKRIRRFLYSRNL